MLVRDLSDDVIRRIKQRAAANGRSTEAEHRAILEAAAREPIESPLEVARRFLAEFDAASSPGAPDGATIIRGFRDGWGAVH